MSVKRESTVSISINKIDLDFLYWHADFICFLPPVNPLDFEFFPFSPGWLIWCVRSIGSGPRGGAQVPGPNIPIITISQHAADQYILLLSFATPAYATDVTKSVCETAPKSFFWAPTYVPVRAMIGLLKSHCRFANQSERKFETHFR